MSEEVRVEATGETVGEAKWSALRELEQRYPTVDKAAVQFDVVSAGERGLLGVGYAPARVVATAPVPPQQPREPAPEAEPEVSAHVRDVVERIAAGLGIDCRVAVAESGGTIVASCSGRELGMLIGKHGQTIDAIQYLVNAIVSRRAGERVEVVVDAAGYRARRDAMLESLALRSAERARSDGVPVELEPMTAVERKVVHVCLKDVPGIATTSEGTEPNRYVVIHPV